VVLIHHSDLVQFTSFGYNIWIVTLTSCRWTCYWILHIFLSRHRVLPTRTARDGGDHTSHWFPHQSPDVEDCWDDVRRSLSRHDVYDDDVDDSTTIVADVDANVKSAFVTVQRTTATVVMHDGRHI